MAIRIGVKAEGVEHTVVIENDRVNYRQMFAVYQVKQGPFGESAGAYAEARAKALADAEDWAAKFKAAGLKVELVGFLS